MTDDMTGPRLAGVKDTEDFVAVAAASGLFDDATLAGFAGMIRAGLAAPEPGLIWLIAGHPDQATGAALLRAEEMAGDVWNLLFIAVAPGARGRGHGTAMIAAAETAAQKAGGRMQLVETAGGEDFAATRAFYSARGYGAEATIRDYYAPGADKVIFRKIL